jgi:hypothetical protein
MSASESERKIYCGILSNSNRKKSQRSLSTFIAAHASISPQIKKCLFSTRERTAEQNCLRCLVRAAKALIKVFFSSSTSSNFDTKQRDSRSGLIYNLFQAREMFFNVLGKMFIDIGGSPEATKTTAKCLFCNKNLLCSTSIRKAPEEARGNFNERTCNCKQSITQRIIYGRLIGDDLSWSNSSKGLSGDEEVLCLSTILKLVR